MKGAATGWRGSLAAAPSRRHSSAYTHRATARTTIYDPVSFLIVPMPGHRRMSTPVSTTAPRHVAYYAPSWPPGTGGPNGIVTALGHTVPAMRARGHAVSVITPVLGDDEGEGRWGERMLRVAAVEPSLSMRLRSRLGGELAARAVRMARQRKAVAHALERAGAEVRVDIFESEESFGLAQDVIDQDRVPVVIRLHGPAQATAQAMGVAVTAAMRARIKAEARVVRSCAGLTAPSRATLGLFSNAPVPKTVIHNPLPCPPAVAEGAAERARGSDHAVFVGRIDRLKGADIAIRAAAMAMTKRPGLRMTLCGPDRGIEADDGTVRGYAAFLRDEVPEALHARFSYRGVLDAAALDALRAEASAVLVTSRTEAFAYSIIEAMRLGCPMIGADTFGIPEMIRHEETGLLVPPGDAQATADALLRLLGDDALSIRLGRAAAAWTRTRLDPALLARETEAFYDRVAPTRGGPPPGRPAHASVLPENPA